MTWNWYNKLGERCEITCLEVCTRKSWTGKLDKDSLKLM